MNGGYSLLNQVILFLNKIGEIFVHTLRHKFLAILPHQSLQPFAEMMDFLKKRSHVCAIISANSCKPNDKLK
jgi:hypothetical protein